MIPSGVWRSGFNDNKRVMTSNVKGVDTMNANLLERDFSLINYMLFKISSEPKKS